MSLKDWIITVYLTSGIFPVWRPENRESWWYKFQSQNWQPLAQEPVFSSQKAGKDWYPSSSSVYSPSDLQLIAWGPPTLERAICFIQSNYSNANLILKPSVFKNSPLSYPLQPFKYLWGSPYAKNCQSKFQDSSFASILILDCRGILPGEVKVLFSL